MLVESKALLGSYNTNPFEFRRKWDVAVQDTVFTFNNKLEIENNLLKDSLSFMAAQMHEMVETQKRMMNHFTEQDDSDELSSEDESLSSKRKRSTRSKATKGKGKGPKKNRQRGEPDGQAAPASGFWESFLGKRVTPPTADKEPEATPGPSTQRDREGTPLSFRSCIPEPTPAQEQRLELAATTKSYWVTKVELELNGSPLDQENF